MAGVSRQKRSSAALRGPAADRSIDPRMIVPPGGLGAGGIHCDAARVYFPFATSVERALRNEWATGVQSEARTPLRDRVMKNKHSAPPPSPPRQIEAHYRGESTGWPVILGGISREAGGSAAIALHERRHHRTDCSQNSSEKSRRSISKGSRSRSFKRRSQTRIFLKRIARQWKSEEVLGRG